MRLQKILFSLFVLFTTQNCGDDKANEIIQIAIKAHGGEEVLKKVNTQYEFGVTSIFLKDTLFRSGSFISYQKKPNKYYYESPVEGPKYSRRLIFASNGEYSWNQNDDALGPYKIPQELHDDDTEYYPYLFTLKERGVQVDYVGEKAINKRMCHQLKYTFKDGSTEDIFFDKENGLLSAIFRVINTTLGPADNRKYYYNYRKINGVMIPFRNESHFEGPEVHIRSLYSAKINSDFDDSIFEVPKAPVLTSAELNQRTGKFSLDNAQITRVTNQGNKLFVSFMEQDDMELMPLSKNIFVFKHGSGSKTRYTSFEYKNFANGLASQIEIIFRGEKYYGKKM